MEQYIIDALNDGSIGLGTALGLFLGALAIGGLIWNFLGPIIEKHDNQIKRKTEEENIQERDKNKIQEDFSSILIRINQITEQQKEYHSAIQQYETKLDEVLTELVETKKENLETQKKMFSIIEGQNEKISDLQKCQEKTNEQIDILIESDKEDIKAYITKEYNYWVFQRGKIDPYSLASIEARFASYRKEHGNTFVEDLVVEIRKLPKTPSSIQYSQDISNENKK